MSWITKSVFNKYHGLDSHDFKYIRSYKYKNKFKTITTNRVYICKKCNKYATITRATNIDDCSIIYLSALSVLTNISNTINYRIDLHGEDMPEFETCEEIIMENILGSA